MTVAPRNDGLLLTMLVVSGGWQPSMVHRIMSLCQTGQACGRAQPPASIRPELAKGLEAAPGPLVRTPHASRGTRRFQAPASAPHRTLGLRQRGGDALYAHLPITASPTYCDPAGCARSLPTTPSRSRSRARPAPTPRRKATRRPKQAACRVPVACRTLAPTWMLLRRLRERDNARAS